MFNWVWERKWGEGRGKSLRLHIVHLSFGSSDHCSLLWLLEVLPAETFYCRRCGLPTSCSDDEGREDYSVAVMGDLRWEVCSSISDLPRTLSSGTHLSIALRSLEPSDTHLKWKLRSRLCCVHLLPHGADWVWFIPWLQRARGGLHVSHRRCWAVIS